MAVTEKRQLDETVYTTKHIVMDIEGTTTSISFVKETLFPYVRKNLDGYLNSHWDEEEFKKVLELLKDQAAEDKKAEMEGAIEIPSEGSDDDVKKAVAKSILWQMDADRKTTALKQLQGQMWRQGYKNGELKGHLFADVAPSLREWAKDGRKLYVYSSGSVEAQKLLFGNSTEGDLTELFSDFFDTKVGAKVDAESYKSIVQKLECSADDVLFLTDLPKEASAAREAGLPVILVEREGNEPLASELRKEFSAVSSFQELAFEATSKKQKTESVTEKDESAKTPLEPTASMEVDSAEKIEEKSESVTKKNEEASDEPMDVKADESEVKTEDKPEVKTEDKPEVKTEDKPEAKTEVTTEVKAGDMSEVEDESKSDVAKENSDVKADEKLNVEMPDIAVEKKDVKNEAEAMDVDKPEESSGLKAVAAEKDTGNAKGDGVLDSITNEKGDNQVSETASEVKDVSTNGTEQSAESQVKDKSVEEKEETPVNEESAQQSSVSKTDGAPEEKTEENIGAEKPETENVHPKEVAKTEETECKSDSTMEAESSVAVEDAKKVDDTEAAKSESEKTDPEPNVEKTEEKVVEEEKKEDAETAASTEITSELEVSKKTNETEKAMSKDETAPEQELKSETKDAKEVEEKLENDGKEKLNGTSNGTSHEASNGTTNGTSNGTSNGTANGDKETDSNGKLENGHKDDKQNISEVIVAKSTTQIDNGSADTGVEVEA